MPGFFSDLTDFIIFFFFRLVGTLGLFAFPSFVCAHPPSHGEVFSPSVSSKGLVLCGFGIDTAVLDSGITSLLHVHVLCKSPPRTRRYRSIQAHNSKVKFWDRTRDTSGQVLPAYIHTPRFPYIHIHLHVRSQPGACFPLRFLLANPGPGLIVLGTLSLHSCRTRRRRRSSRPRGSSQPANQSAH